MVRRTVLQKLTGREIADAGWRPQPKDCYPNGMSTFTKFVTKIKNELLRY